MPDRSLAAASVVVVIVVVVYEATSVRCQSLVRVNKRKALVCQLNLVRSVPSHNLLDVLI